MISPTTDGTKATLPGIARRSVHLCFAPGGQMQFERQLIAISSTGLIGSSLVKEIDDALLYYEFLHFAGEKISETVPAIKSSPDFSFIPPAEAEKKFLSLFTILS